MNPISFYYLSNIKEAALKKFTNVKLSYKHTYAHCSPDHTHNLEAPDAATWWRSMQDLTECTYLSFSVDSKVLKNGFG